MINFMKKSYKIDSKYILRIVVLIMEDIYEKLNLIDYKDLFCKTLNLPLINKLYLVRNLVARVLKEAVWVIVSLHWS